jgi:glucose uptake protein GlcU
LAVGVFGWATAVTPWQLLVASVLSGVGWGAMSAAAVNAIVSPWFVRSRPAALGMAYNGGSIGGVIFSPLWVAAIGVLGFSNAAAAIAQAGYAFAPAIFGLVRELAPHAPGVFIAAAVAQGLAICAFSIGRNR